MGDEASPVRELFTDHLILIKGVRFSMLPDGFLREAYARLHETYGVVRSAASVLTQYLEEHCPTHASTLKTGVLRRLKGDPLDLRKYLVDEGRL